jgi:hypothetical protein
LARAAGTSQARRSHSQPHLTVPCSPSPTNCWLLCVCPPTLLRPQSQPALCAKPGPGIPCHPASRFRALRTRQDIATPASPTDTPPQTPGRLGSAQSPPCLTHAQSPHRLTPAAASPLLASETLASSLAYAASRSCAGPQCQSALRAKPSPGFPCDPSKPVLGIARKAEGATPANPLGVGTPPFVRVRLARKNAKDTGGIFLASRTLTSPPKLVWPLAVAVSRWA